MAEMKLIMVLLLPLLCLIAPLTRGIPVNHTYCVAKADDYPVTVLIVDISPQPAVVFEEVSFTVIGNIAEAISGGVLKHEISDSVFIIFSNDFELCGERESIFGACPVGAGLFSLSRSNPGGFLPHTSHIKAIVTDEENRELTCVEFDFEVAAASCGRYLARAT